MRSASPNISSRLWLTIITVIPSSWSRSTVSWTSSVASTESALVGSSRMTSCGSNASARAMATSWRCPREELDLGVGVDVRPVEDVREQVLGPAVGLRPVDEP